MRIFMTGDVHNSISVSKFNMRNFPIQKDLSKEDLVIVAGDFGFPWTDGESKEDTYWLDWLNDRSFTTLFVDGNHENFNALEEYPEDTFKDAKVHRLRDSVFHIQRGETMVLNGLKFLFMGGAHSVDKAFRKEGVSWWSQEVPSEEDWERAFKAASGIDVVVTHEAPSEVVGELFGYEADSISHKMQMLFDSMTEPKPKVWFFGHHHSNKKLIKDGTFFFCVYEDIVELNLTKESSGDTPERVQKKL